MTTNTSGSIEALRVQVRFQSLLIDTIPSPMFYKDMNGAYQMCNPAFAEQVLGLPRERIIGSTVYDLPEAIPPHLADNYHEHDMALIRNAGTQVYEAQVKFKDGELHDVMFHKSTVHDDDGEIIGMVGIMLDITERKRAETLAEQEQHQREIIEAQHRALAELSTPIIKVRDGVIVLPIVGTIDSQRAREIMRGLLKGISDHRARNVIIDITAVPVVDTGVADYLNKTIQAARLKGAKTIVTGISDAVAETLVDLGIDWSHLEVHRDLQSGLESAEDSSFNTDR